jgi:hypothetical protein
MGGDRIFFCHFQALKPAGTSESKLGTSPTKTYMVTAHANYTYSVSKEKLVRLEFGSWCCTQEKGVCLDDQKCCPENKVSGKGICTPKTQNCEGGEAAPETFLVADPGYCVSRYQSGYGKCLLGWGGCSVNTDCCQAGSECPADYVTSGYSLVDTGTGGYGDLVCRTDMGVCCFQNAPAEKCIRAYDAWSGNTPPKGDAAYYQSMFSGFDIRAYSDMDVAG